LVFQRGEGLSLVLNEVVMTPRPWTPTKTTLTSFDPGPEKAYYGYFGVQIAYSHPFNKSERDSMMKWCNEHRIAAYYVVDTRWYFETEKERMLFLLRWS